MIVSYPIITWSSHGRRKPNRNLIVYNKKKTLLKSMGTGNPHVMTNFLSSVQNNKKTAAAAMIFGEQKKKKRNVQVFIHVILFVFSNKCAAISTGIRTRKKKRKVFRLLSRGTKGQNWNFILSRKSRVRKSKTAKLFGKLPSTWVKVFSLPPLTLFDEFHFVCLLNC